MMGKKALMVFVMFWTTAKSFCLDNKSFMKEGLCSMQKSRNMYRMVSVRQFFVTFFCQLFIVALEDVKGSYSIAATPLEVPQYEFGTS